MDVHVDRHGVVNVSGELDASTAPRLAVALDRLADDGGVVCVDVSRLDFCGAAGINVLARIGRTLGTGGRLVIYDAPPNVARVIEITGLDQLVDVTVSRVIAASDVVCANGPGDRSAPRTSPTGGGVSMPGAAMVGSSGLAGASIDGG